MAYTYITNFTDRRVMDMKDDKKKPDKKSPKHKEERLSEREWKELRGEFMPTYTRKHGAVRNKRY
jgi:hypothetical protein